MAHDQRALPELTDLTAAHWTSGASGRLSVRRCVRCLRWSFPPSRCCRHCWSADFTVEPVTGKGVLLTWTEVRDPGAQERSPYLVAVVELEEGIRLLLGLTGTEPGALRVDMPIRLYFEHLGGDIWLPLAEIEELELPEDRLEAVS
ncbi:Zn-ribbon domain-containing OB-fold protein [Rhodococcus sp. UNC363MFTsu5.1]|uniref:Zn-ribbon domain-containing OB-fold protein n=1 Tax=Rhodococcus sp. UNC363MFTsu5.1 TaxID=1449069 RepID=UPI00068E4437|nr:OB-fold domain-containing protein [Rhodococcus sp. UNC363MFTsu5.1]